ncbi:hypothetical protein HW260_02110 [Helicobacter cinaedi]|uniref:Periplasmic protein n=1 Tax=Helicobacter cinaedi CCUG 18818 = ATCC BAA-847 TaxID=537971 RepID=A0AAI8MNK1_9HELI|nr:hypothetical protein [Helicobacter cinaedi]EFR45488.1 hypothetical protein HCCG_00034 [Helicobacter cinaedi CCUG 18818 = ATCC BAA-847]QOQ91175.1 hypothetical protein HW260_02110 [Helicobacter cinaedi]BAM32868.1 hypothetical protein HCBAA847_1638 [Helicobacter cinaedi CCUG 18818 = ATCC BAA-847]
MIKQILIIGLFLCGLGSAVAFSTTQEKEKVCKIGGDNAKALFQSGFNQATGACK